MPYGDKLAERLALTLVPPGMDADIDKKRAEMQAAQGPQQPDPMQEIAVATAAEDLKNKAADTAKKQAEVEKIGAQTAQIAQDVVISPIERGHRLGSAGNGSGGGVT
jgi:hypothetical protein